MDNSFGAPESFLDVLIVPILAVFFGVLIRLLAWNRDRQAKDSRSLKWVSLAVVSIGVYAGFQFVWSMIDFFHPAVADMYRLSAAQRGRRIEIAHYVAFGLPLVVLIAIIVWNKAERRLGRPLAV